MNKLKLLIVGCILFFVVICAILFIVNKKSINITNKDLQPEGSVKTSMVSIRKSQRLVLVPTIIPRPILGSMTVQTSGGVKRFPLNKEMTLTIVASSGGKNIVGYDAILSFDKKAFTFIKTTSLIPDFNVFSYERPTYLSMSAIKSLQNNKVIPWENQSLVEVTFKPIKTGNYSFLLSPEGKETSKLVDDKAAVVYPSTDKLELEIY